MLGTLVAENDVPLPALCCVVIFTACAWVLARRLLRFDGRGAPVPPQFASEI